MWRKIPVLLLAIIISAVSQAEIIEKEFVVEPNQTLYVDTEVGGDLAVTGWDKESVLVTTTFKGSACDDLDLDISLRSGDVYVNANCDHRNWGSDCDIEFKIMVPDHFNLDLESKGGDFTIINVTGRLEGETMGGDMEFVRLNGYMHFVTMGGEIDLRNSNVDGLVKTMGGSVTIRDVVGDIKGKTMGGNVYYKNVTSKDEGTLETSTMGGNIDIHSKNQSVKASTMGGNINASGTEVNVSTMGGDIDVKDASLGAKVHTMGGDIYVKSANIFVNAKTMGGDIDIDAIDGWIKAITMGGDIKVQMIGDPKSGERHVQLTSFGGDVDLRIPDGLDMEFDIELIYTKNHRRKYSITSDYNIKLEESDEWEKSFFREPRKVIYGTGTVGDGTHLIKIKTTNGNIFIHKS